MRRATKTLLVSAGVLAGTLALVLAGAAWLLTTTPGARWTIDRLAAFAPGELGVGRVEGSLVRGLRVQDVRFEAQQLNAAAATLVIEVQLGELPARRVVVERLALENATIALLDSNAPAEPAGETLALPEIPVWLEVRSVRLRDVLLQAGGTSVELVALDASAGGSVVALDRLEVRHDAAGAHVALSGTLELAAGAEPPTAALAWNRLAVQAGGTQWSSPAGRLVVRPGARAIEAELTADLTSSPLPGSAAIATSARQTGDTLELLDLTLEALGGRIAARGVADVAALAGHASIEYSLPDASRLDPRVEGRLAGNVVAAFALTAEPVAAASGVVGGELGGRPLDGTLRAWLRDGVSYLEGARIALDGSVVEVAGRVSADEIDVELDAQLPELASWYPPVTGSLRVTGSVAGAARNPSVALELVADDVSVETSPPIDELSLDVTGTLVEHDVSLAARTAYGTFRARVAQGLEGGRLAGTLLDSRIALERAGTWTLTGPAAYSLAGAEPTLEQLCYSGPENAHLCAAVADDTLEVDATSLPSSLADPWLGADRRLSGAADLTLTLGWRPALHGSLRLTQPELRLRAARDDGVPGAADFASIEGLELTGTLTEQALDVRLTAALAATGDPLEARLSLTPPTADGALDAAVSARLTSLELVDALLDDVEELTGTLAVSLHAAGSLAEPEIGGELTASGLGALVAPLGIELSSGRLSAQAVGLDAVEFDAELCSSGCVTLGGSVTVTPTESTPWRVAAELTGHSFELADLPELQAVIAPQLTLDATPAAWLVTGEIAIEQGVAVVDAVPRGAVRPVPETVVHGRRDEAAAEGLPVPLVVDVAVRLGDVRFEGLGLSAELDGALDIDRTADGRLLVNGTASIERGTFSAYSQELTVERGDLMFAGPPDNPALDVRATREVAGATVGIAVTGTLRDPRSEIFSSPPLTESEALARLVTGRSLASAGATDAQAIERAALGLGIRRALPALSRIGENLGLDELGVESAGSESGALVAGRQLGEDVYLRYKHGLFDDFAGLELIYRITERFRLRTETGTSQSIDVLYERNPREQTALAETESSFDDENRPPVQAGPVSP